jgi:hypothetical protein
VAIPSVSAISAGFKFSIALSDERLFSWGANETGQLGNGTTTASVTPQQVPGVAGVTAIAASEKFTLGIAEQGSSPDLRVLPRPGALLLEWVNPGGGEQWTVSFRPFTQPFSMWSKRVFLPASSSSYLITGLSHVVYEVRLTRTESSFGFRIAFGLPG